MRRKGRVSKAKKGLVSKPAPLSLCAPAVTSHFRGLPIDNKEAQTRVGRKWLLLRIWHRVSPACLVVQSVTLITCKTCISHGRIKVLTRTVLMTDPSPVIKPRIDEKPLLSLTRTPRLSRRFCRSWRWDQPAEPSDSKGHGGR